MNHKEKSPVVVGLGEILWDVFPDGPRFGGAPANFACHAASLGGRAFVVSAVGNDPLGDDALVELEKRGVDPKYVARADKPTGQVKVEVDAKGQPTYAFDKDGAWDHIVWTTDLQTLATSTDAVCFGTLAQRHPESRASIHQFVANVADSNWRVFDVNFRQSFFTKDLVDTSLRLANAVKLNEDEMQVMREWFGLPASPKAALDQLAETYQLGAIALTQGADGSTLWKQGEWDRRAVEKTEVTDTVGAGDAFTAAWLTGLMAHRELASIHRCAAKIAAFVCTQPGATPALPAELVADC